MLATSPTEPSLTIPENSKDERSFFLTLILDLNVSSIHLVLFEDARIRSCLLGASAPFAFWKAHSVFWQQPQFVKFHRREIQ